MHSFKAKAVEDIPANRLIALGGINSEGDPEAGWETIYLIPCRLGWIPDFVSNRELKKGEWVTVTIKNNPIWEAEAAEDLPAGTAIQCTEDGRVKHYVPADGNHIGCTLHSVKAGETVKFFRKYGTMPQTQMETMSTLQVTEEKKEAKKSTRKKASE